MGTLSLWILLPGLQRGDAGVGFSDEIPTVPIYLATQSQVFWHYVFLCLWPSELSIDYRWPPVKSVAASIPWIVPTLTLLAFGIWRYHKRQLSGWLILCLFLLLAPTSTLIPITDLAVEHRMYLGSAAVISLCVMLVHYLVSLSPARNALSPAFRIGLLCLLLGFLSLRTFARSQDWSSAFSLWLSAAKVSPSNPRALQNFTSAAIDEGREPELTAALIQLRQQAVAAGDFAPAVASRLGEEYLKAGNPAQAEPLLLEAVEGLDPSGTNDERQEHAAARINLALVHLNRSEFEEAEKHLRAGVRSDPLAAYGFAILGDLLMRKADFAEAAKQFRAALAIQPDWKQVENDLAKAEAALAE
jgi:protein O-mannosyl-transferase